MIQSLEAKLLKNLTLKGTANWYYSEGAYESFTKDYQTNQEGTSWNRTRKSTAKFERTFHKPITLY